MAIRICILIIQIINLTINGLNAPTKRLSSWADKKIKTGIYVYKRPTSDLGTLTD